MGKGLPVYWEDENGKRLAAFTEPGFDVRLIDHADPATSPCLRFVDPYGDTVFNQTQIEALTEELASIRQNSTDAALLVSIDGLTKFAERCRETHTYLRVFGD